MSPSTAATAEFLATAADHPDVAAEKARSFEVLALVPGARVLDVGCGLARDLETLASLVRPAGRAHGVDLDPSMLQHARQGVIPHDDGAQLVCASATRLPYPAGAFDAVRIDRVLQHVHGPEQTLCEVFRVLRSGGVAYVADTDWSTLTISCLPRDLHERIRDFYLNAAVAQPTVGSQLARMIARFKARNVDVRGLTIVSRTLPPALGHLDRARQLGFLDEQEVARVVQLTEQAEAAGHLVAGVTMFSITVTK
jgi:ubiquinone/menaquinone biosynthesis C-methylase UbiE